MASVNLDFFPKCTGERDLKELQVHLEEYKEHNIGQSLKVFKTISYNE